MPGWQRAPGWTLSNKIYISPGEDVEREPLSTVPEDERHIYEVKFNKIVNLYISPGDVIEITRTLLDNSYTEIRAIPFIDRKDGGLDEWIAEITKDLCDVNWERTNFEVGGGFQRGDNPCEIEILFKKYTPPKRKKIPEADITLYKEIQKRLEGYKKQIEKLEGRRNELEKIMEKTDSEIDELRDIRNKLERLFRTERGDIAQIERLKEKYPDIEEML